MFRALKSARFLRTLISTGENKVLRTMILPCKLYNIVGEK